MNLSHFQKCIYNKYLEVTRTSQDKPWRPRKDFTKLTDLEYSQILKIEKILNENKINYDYYFRAPYELWSDSDFQPLQFFTTRKAIAVYNKWFNKLILTEPDNSIVIEYTKLGFYNIYKKCIELKLGCIEDYFNIVTTYPEFILDLKDRNITYYNILSVDSYQNTLKQFKKDTIEFIIDDFYNIICSLRAKYYNSKQKELNKKIITKLNKYITE